jgi:predicted acylesterase/phospholipase RssA
MSDQKSSLSDKFCDLVMKGGITSGVVYPKAIDELAHEYMFKNIGGTSAGAIAASLTAAADWQQPAAICG